MMRKGVLEVYGPDQLLCECSLFRSSLDTRSLTTKDRLTNRRGHSQAVQIQADQDF